MRKDREVGREQRREEGQGALRGSPVRVQVEDPLILHWNMILSLLACLRKVWLL